MAFSHSKTIPSAAASAAVPLPPTHNALVVRSLLAVTPEQRRKVLEDVEYNVFAFPAGLVTCDFLSDSGTSAMTDIQWAAMLRGDESYGRNWGYYCLLDAFRDTFERGAAGARRVVHDMVMGKADMALYRDELLLPQEGGFVNGGPFQLIRPNTFLVPQGRCAEALLFSTLRLMIAEAAPRSSIAPPRQPVIISNGFFDTTGANAAVAGFQLQTFTQPGLNDPFPLELVGRENPFKGNLDVAATEAYIESLEDPSDVKMILQTITNNWAGAQPVSMANIRAASELARRRGIPFFFDACRFAENAYFIQRFEAGYAGVMIQDIVQEMFTHVDGFTISLKKDGLANMGGALCFKDESLFAKKYPGIGMRMKERQILCYGNDSYGGMSGRDLMAAATGLYEVVKQPYLQNRIGQVERFAQRLQASGVSVLLPPGGHAVYLDMDAFFKYCDRSPGDFASVGFVLELLEKYGIRAAEAGPFGWEWDKKPPAEQALIPNLVRLAVPRYVLSEEHITYTVAAILELYNHRHTIPNVEISRGRDMRLRHFSCGLKPVPVKKAISLPDEHSGGVVPAASQATYLSEAKRQIAHLSHAVGQTALEKEQLTEALAFSTGTWSTQPIASPEDKEAAFAGWISEVSNDHSPYEYSVAIDQRSGAAELRFLIEAQPTHNSLPALTDAAMSMARQIGAKYQDTVSLDRFELIRDLFVPPQPSGLAIYNNNAGGSETAEQEGDSATTSFDETSLFSAWFSCALSAKSGPEWKIYLNPRAQGSQHAAGITRTAFERLGLAESWALLEAMMAGTEDAVVYFSLDLSPSSENRVKVYISHPRTTAGEIAGKLAGLCPETSAYEVERFVRCMAGGEAGEGPFEGKSLLTCFAFTSKDPLRPVGTVHFPIIAYAGDDQVVRDRVEGYMDAVGVSDKFRSKYTDVISAVQRRPLEDGRGIHAWVSLKSKAGGKKVNTFYISPELYGPVFEAEIDIGPRKRSKRDSRDSGVFVETPEE
ncbi:beta-eliminating lyase [Microdochium trichocladiopsis]|uniref:Beta-eliminating lyase n=1 Tax=Microdochium trichocladiopsis TaxID=1682393 RepID=A0A9P8XXM5_9PEZI|nr:beta-eliminating lyase [Microdochium trichocladiopsis]KAH7024470.1 beta-eliminating lyase [Microdochium trichocladiopsis]